MKQAIHHNNTDVNSRELSIQVTPSGFSFMVSQNGAILFGSEAKSYDFEAVIGDPSRYNSIFVGWNTDSVMLFPGEIFEADHVEDYLLAANLSDPTTSPLFNETLDKDVVALWTIDSHLYQLLEKFIPKAYYYHNLQVDILHTELESVRISIVENLANVVIATRDGLHAAETIVFGTPEDLLYFVSKINLIDKFSRHSLEIIAEDTDPYKGLFSRHFAKCEFASSGNIYHSIVLRCE